VTAARVIQPTTSLIAAEVMVMTPMGVRVRSNSIMMRPRMGTAVMDSAVARNRL
jgi:hypothetical protein